MGLRDCSTCGELDKKKRIACITCTIFRGQWLNWYPKKEGEIWNQSFGEKKEQNAGTRAG